MTENKIMTRIFLIGYMGAGKTTIGNALAEAMNLRFVDVDAYIETRYRKSIGQLFAEKDESGFREIESAILKEVSDFENVIISTGGGAPCFFDNMSLMNEKGTTLYLKASPETLTKRLNKCKDKRPLIKDKSESELLNFISEALNNREPFYNRASVIFETGESESKEEILRCINHLQERLK
jgi:shikimate kinase